MRLDHSLTTRVVLDVSPDVLARVDRLLDLLGDAGGLTAAELQAVTDRLNAHDERLRGLTTPPSPAPA